MQLTVEDIKDIVISKMIDNWQLKEVKLCKLSQYSGGCKIGGERLKHLSQANWPNLQKLYLSKYSYTQMLIKLEIKGASI